MCQMSGAIGSRTDTSFPFPQYPVSNALGPQGCRVGSQSSRQGHHCFWFPKTSQDRSRGRSMMQQPMQQPMQQSCQSGKAWADGKSRTSATEVTHWLLLGVIRQFLCSSQESHCSRKLCALVKWKRCQDKRGCALNLTSASQSERPSLACRSSCGFCWERRIVPQY